MTARFPARGFGGIGFIEKARRTFDERRSAGAQQGGRPQDADQHDGASRRIVGQHCYRVAMVLDLAVDDFAGIEAYARDAQAGPALVDAAGRKDLRHGDLGVRWDCI